MSKRNIIFATALIACIFVVGCSQFMMSDFENATKIAQIKIGHSNTVAGSIDLPKGDADIRFVVRDYDCKQALDASINIDLQFADGANKKLAVNLNDLTWPTSGQGCHPIGYLRLDDSKYTHPLQFIVDQNSNPVKFSIKITSAVEADMQVAIWVVYNDREPINRMLGNNK